MAHRAKCPTRRKNPWGWPVTSTENAKRFVAASTFGSAIARRRRAICVAILLPCPARGCVSFSKQFRALGRITVLFAGVWATAGAVLGAIAGPSMTEDATLIAAAKFAVMCG